MLSAMQQHHDAVLSRPSHRCSEAAHSKGQAHERALCAATYTSHDDDITRFVLEPLFAQLATILSSACSLRTREGSRLQMTTRTAASRL